MREELIARKSGVTGRGAREEMNMIGEDGSCEKDLRLFGKEFHKRVKVLWKERSENVSLEVRDGRERE